MVLILIKSYQFLTQPTSHQRVSDVLSHTPLDFLACCMDSIVWFMTPSSAATTRMMMSVTRAPLALMAVNAAWPGVSRNVILSPEGNWTGGKFKSMHTVMTRSVVGYHSMDHAWLILRKFQSGIVLRIQNQIQSPVISSVNHPTPGITCLCSGCQEIYAINDKKTCQQLLLSKWSGMFVQNIAASNNNTEWSANTMYMYMCVLPQTISPLQFLSSLPRKASMCWGISVSNNSNSNSIHHTLHLHWLNFTYYCYYYHYHHYPEKLQCVAWCLRPPWLPPGSCADCPARWSCRDPHDPW